LGMGNALPIRNHAKSPETGFESSKGTSGESEVSLQRTNLIVSECAVIRGVPDIPSWVAPPPDRAKLTRSYSCNTFQIRRVNPMECLRVATALFLFTIPLSASAQAPQPIPIETAQTYFSEAQSLCQADHG
jgi:hypothetical protein